MLRYFCCCALLFLSGFAAADEKEDAIQGVLQTFNADSGDIDKLLEVRYAINDALFAIAADFFNDTADFPQWGEAGVLVVEFSDYQCGYCKRMFPLLEESVQDNKARMVVVEFPILGVLSEKASRYALAAKAQGKYVKFHKQLMLGGRLTESGLEEAAESLGLDMVRLQEDAESDATTKALEKNYKLAQLLSVTATPSFLVGGDVLVRGALQEEDFQRLLSDTANRE